MPLAHRRFRGRSGLGTPPAHGGAMPTRLRVLVVEDEPLIRWAVSEALGQTGHDVVEAADACAAAAVLAHDAAFDLVLTDYHLPDCSELTLLASIRRLAPRSRVAMMSACMPREIEERARAMGAFRVLPKPFDLQHLRALVADAGCPDATSLVLNADT